jgi:hypothetical protein
VSATLRSQCEKCPWRHLDDPDLPFTPAVIEAARKGEKFVCHVRMGPCDGPSHAGVYQEAQS